MNSSTMHLAGLDEALSCGPWLHGNLDRHARDTQAIASDTSTDGEGRTHFGNTRYTTVRVQRLKLRSKYLIDLVRSL